jgi:hypothetical protein
MHIARLLILLEKGLQFEAVVRRMCMYAVLYAVGILFSMLIISFISTNETVIKWPCAIEIKGQGDLFNNPGESNLYLIVFN